MIRSSLSIYLSIDLLARRLNHHIAKWIGKNKVTIVDQVKWTCTKKLVAPRSRQVVEQDTSDMFCYLAHPLKISMDLYGGKRSGAKLMDGIRNHNFGYRPS